MRVTKLQVCRMFEQVCNQLNKKPGHKVGEWGIDYSGVYGGYLVIEYGDRGCENHPFISKRMKASAMYDFLYGILLGARHMAEVK